MLRPLAALAAALCLAPAAVDGSCSTYSYLSLDVAADDAPQLCALPGPFAGMPNRTAETIQRAVFVKSETDMCGAADAGGARKALDAALAGCSNCQPVLLVDRGSCTFVDKLNHSRTAMDGLVPAGAAPKVLLIDYASNGCGPYVSMSVDGLGKGALLPAFCPSDTGAALERLRGPQTLRLETVQSADEAQWQRTEACPSVCHGLDHLDGSLAVLLLLATLTVVVGAHGSGTMMTEKLRARMAPLPGATCPQPRPEDDGSVVITAKMAALYAVVASCGLLLMYLFLETIVMFMIFYVVFVASCVAALLTTGWLAPHMPQKRVLIPKLGPVVVSELAICLACAGIGVLFFFGRHESWSWVLQDYLCLNLCVYIIRMWELPNAKVATILLCALFLYDVFWVYGSPYLVALFASSCKPEDLATDPNNSVMVHVARGVPATAEKPAESIPIVIRMPRWDFDDDQPGQHAESLLGLGDIIIPALSAALLWRFDLAAGRSWKGPLCLPGTRQPHPEHFASGYFVPSLIGYVLALICAYLVVGFWCVAQPALFYIVPLSLWTVLALAYRRGDLRQLWEVGPDPNWTPPPSLARLSSTEQPAPQSAASSSPPGGAGGTKEQLIDSSEPS